VTFTRDVNGLDELNGWNGLDELDGLNGLDGLNRLDADLASECPATWTKFKRRCYKFFSHPAKWIKAEVMCTTRFGQT